MCPVLSAMVTARWMLETDAVIQGILIAAGSLGMTVNFGEKSAGLYLLNTGSQEAGTDIVLTDASGTELLSWQSSKAMHLL